MSRHRDVELWREVTRTTVGLTGIVEPFASACAERIAWTWRGR
ncbi:MAG: hypothetical protein ACRDQD_17835 [Nocardioidaceae bacterium]